MLTVYKSTVLEPGSCIKAKGHQQVQTLRMPLVYYDFRPLESRLIEMSLSPTVTGSFQQPVFVKHRMLVDEECH